MSEDNQESTEAETTQGKENDEVVGSSALRPVFLGNLSSSYKTEDVIEIFERPILPRDAAEGSFSKMPVERIDHKRGYCFVFLKDVTSQSEKEQTERFVNSITGMNVPNVSDALRAEFARGDGRVKRKEDERRKNIEPSDTLFVVNFHEQTTKREDLQMLFEPFGELVRIDMKRNYAFVQFRTIEQATKAKESTDGGKLDQSVLTVEYVARQQRNGGGGGGGGDRRGRRDDRRGRRYDDRRGPPPPNFRGPPPPPGYDRDRDYPPPRRDDRGGDYYDRRRSPSPPYRRPRSRSRSRSPPRHYRSRSPPSRRYDDRYGEYRRSPSPPRYRGGRSPDRGGPAPPPPGRDFYRGDRDRDRGYR